MIKQEKRGTYHFL